MADPLPIDALLPEIEAALRTGPNLVITADPGAGKTTRVPPHLLAQGIVTEGQIVVAQPRRLAARMAAQRVASVLGEPVGKRVGYQVRFESKVSSATRIRFVTEGLLVRQLRDDPTLAGVAAVVLDEFHERHVDTDVALALLRRLQTTRRPQLRIIVMSATLDAEPVARFLDAPAVNSPGRAFAVEIEHCSGKGERPLGSQVADAVRQLGSTGLDGSVLVFLPGVREIRECTKSCTGVAKQLGLDVVGLYGDLSAGEQDRVVRPGPRPKLILSTNVAETSITIEGIAAVIDSGLVRRPSHDPWSGLPTLTLAKTAKASAAQRAGRAGRTREGRCIRLFAEHDLARRPAYDSPELHRLDLAGAMLDLRAHGLRSSDELSWLDPPPRPAIEAAETLLRRLGAVDERGVLGEVGREMLGYPTHPRLARLLVEARRRGVAGLGAWAAALIGERPLRRHDPRGGPATSDAHAADVLADIALIERGRTERTSVDRGALAQITKVRRQLFDRLKSLPRVPSSTTPEDDLCIAMLLGFPDRVARVEVRNGAPDRVVMAAGGDAELATDSAVHGAEFVVAVAAVQRHDPGRRAPRTIVRSAAAIEPEWLLELEGDALVEHTQAHFDPQTERVEAVAQTRYEALVIDSTVLRHVPPEATALLREAARGKGVRAFVRDPAAFDAWRLRLAFVAEHRPQWPAPTDEELAQALDALCEGKRSFAELRKADVLAVLKGQRPSELLAALPRLAPERVTLAGGRRLQVHYEIDRPPWVETRLQDFFGSADGPAVMEGQVPLVLHLLAPNRRAVQVTTDLAGFWERHYPEIRKTLMRRYPKHAWPEDGRTAEPPKPRPPRSRKRKR